MARNNQRKATKSRLLGLDSSRRTLNSSKTVDEVTYYSLADLETVIASVLSEVSSDPTVGITLSAADTGIVLNCVNENGDEYTVDVDLESEDGDVAGEDVSVEEVNAARRRMNSSRRRMNSSRRRMNASKKTTGGKRRLNCSSEYFAVPLSDRSTIGMIDDDTVDDYDIYDIISDKGYEISEDKMYKDEDKFYYLTWDTEGEYLEG